MLDVGERRREQKPQKPHREQAWALRSSVTQADGTDVNADDNAPQDAQPHA